MSFFEIVIAVLAGLVFLAGGILLALLIFLALGVDDMDNLNQN